MYCMVIPVLHVYVCIVCIACMVCICMYLHVLYVFFRVNTYIIQTAGFTYIQIQTCRVPDGMHISAPPAARPFGDRGPLAGRRSCLTRSESYASSHAHLGTAGRATPLGTVGRERAGGAARLGADLRVYACLSRHRRPRNPQGDRGLRAGRRSCVTRSGHTDVGVTQ